MPIYEYRCLDCEQPFEFLKRSASVEPECPSCGGSKAHQQVSLCAVSLGARSAASLSAAHKRAASRRQDKQRSEHASDHGHFGDTALR